MTKIGDLVEMMADAADEGGSAVEVLRKQAQEQNLTPDQIRLVARSYNVGTVGGSRKAAGILSTIEQIRQKVDIPSVDPEPIISDLFSTKVASRAAVFHDSAIDQVYSMPFTQLDYIEAEKKAEKAVRINEGLALLEKDVKAPKLAFQCDAVAMAPWNWLKVQKNALDKALTAKTAAEEKAYRSIETLRDYFLSTSPVDRVAWSDFRKRASFIYGDCTNTILDRVGQGLPTPMLKRAAAADRSDASKGPYLLLANSLQAFADWEATDTVVKEAMKKVAEADAKVPKGTKPAFVGAAGMSLLGTTKQSIDRAEKGLVLDEIRREDNLDMAIKRSKAAGGVSGPRGVSLLKLMRGELPDPKKDKAAGVLGPMVASNLGMGIGKEIGSHIPGAVPIEKLEDSAYNQLTDPAQERELSGIRAESMLSQMINSDDVLSHQDPNTVISHYNELSQLAPNIMQQPAAARAILRQVLTTGGMTPYDIQQIQTMNQIGQKPPSAKPPSPGA